MTAQINILDEMIIDNFAGGGGASTGIELATGRPVDIAINHDPDAILLHKTNHPYTKHLQASVWDVDPREVCAGRKVGLAWFSPDCKHFSKAKGGKPVDKNIRGLAWIVLRWAGTVRPRVIILENVEEFQTWGPVRRGKPVKSKAGQTFRQWKRQLSDLGYKIDHRELIAADYGAPTIRKRFFLIARCDGLPIVWPEPTHSEHGENGLPKWKAAADIINWDLLTPSIFDSRQEIKEKYDLYAVRPLADNTLRRIIRGVDKFTIKSGNPFIVSNNNNNAPHDINGAVPTITTGNRNLLLMPNMMAIGQTGGGDRIRGIDEPINTQVSKAETCVTAASLIQYHTEQSEKVRGQGLEDPLQTVDAANRYGLASANLVEYFGNGNPLDVNEPLHTVTSKDREALTVAHIQKYFGGVVGTGVEKPLPTVTAMDHNALCLSHICKFKGREKGQDLLRPLHTLTTQPEFAAVNTTVIKYTDNINLYHWPEIRDLLNKYCGYTLADNEVLLLGIENVWYFIADIGLRMLSPRELYNAQGFPDDYIIDYDYKGNTYGKTKQVARCGNAVCPPLATALVKSNLPECCSRRYKSMKELNSDIAI